MLIWWHLCAGYHTSETACSLSPILQLHTHAHTDASSECRGRLARRLAAELEQRMAQSKQHASQVEAHTQSDSPSQSDSQMEGSTQSDSPTQSEPLPQNEGGWLQHAKELIRLAALMPQPSQRPLSLPPHHAAQDQAAAHLTAAQHTSLPHHQLQQHQPQPQQPCSTSQQQEAAVNTLHPPANDSDAFQAAAAQQAQLLARMQAARRGSQVSTKEQGVSEAVGDCSTLPAQEQGVGHTQPEEHRGVQGCINQDGSGTQAKKRRCETDEAGADACAQGMSDVGTASTRAVRRCKQRTWRLADQTSWLPCAVGCLPDASLVGGRLPRLGN